jgi:N-acetylmuramoyl-L-alanine amidase
MLRYLRATGIAGAVMTLAAGAAYADTSMAPEADTANAVRYIDHAAADLDGATLASARMETPAIPAQQVDFSNSLLDHAVATVDEPVIAPEPALKSRSLRELVGEHARSQAVDDEHECLAEAVYFESKGEPLEGQLAVAEVVINRAESGRYPATLCGVVKQRGQFSFVRGGHIPSAPSGTEAWRKAVAIAHIARQELAESKAEDAMFFHATRVRPSWRGLKRVAAVGNHIFYR